MPSDNLTRTSGRISRLLRNTPLSSLQPKRKPKGRLEANLPEL